MARGNADRRYKTEVELCTEYAEWVRAHGFKVYPETSGWDLLLVATEKHGPVVVGDQIGVQAKLRANLEVLEQASRDDPEFTVYANARGPNWRVVLVPDYSGAFHEVARRLKLVVVAPRHSFGTPMGFAPHAQYFHVESRRMPAKPEWVPDVEMWTPPGAPSPRSLTKWKLAALRLCALAERRGYLTKADFAAAKVSMSRWVAAKGPKGANTWIRGYRVDCGDGTTEYRYTLLPAAPHTQYPEEYAAVLAAEKATK